MMRWLSVPVVLALCAIATGSPIDLEKLPPERCFDFLVGDWRATTGAGATWSLRVAPILHGQALQAETDTALSVYSYVPPAGEWRMTWVSDIGHHDALRGGREGDRLVLNQAVLRDRPGAIGRLVYSRIATDGFHMDWEVSSDRGATWSNELAVDFVRTAPRPVPREQTAAALEPAAREALGTQLFRLGRWNALLRWNAPDGAAEGRGEIIAVVGPDGRSIIETLWLSVNNQQRVTRVRTYRCDPQSRSVTIVNAQAGRPEHGGRIETDEHGWLERDQVHGDGGAFDAVYRYESLTPDHYRARRSEFPASGEKRIDALVYDAYRAP